MGWRPQSSVTQEAAVPTAISKNLSVALPALLRLLRNQSADIRKRVVTYDETQQLAQECETSATMAELDHKHQLFHGALFRGLHRASVELRHKAPRRNP